MATPDVTAGRPTGDSQSHDHEKRARSYGFQSGGTVLHVDHSGNNTRAPDSGTNGYVNDASTGGNSVKLNGSPLPNPLPPGVNPTV